MQFVTPLTLTPSLGMPQLLELRSALNEKELELIELREQHVQLVVRGKLDKLQLLLIEG